MPYFNHHNSPSFLSFYEEKRVIRNTDKNTFIEKNEIVSVMTSRPLHIHICRTPSGIQEVDEQFDAYYVDYLCVHPEKRQSGIAPQVIQTHEYNQRHANKAIKVSLFKREGTLTGIVPLCVYNTYGFLYPASIIQHLHFPARLNVVNVSYKHLESFYDFLKSNESKFDLCAQPHISNWMELVKTENIYLYLLIDETQEVHGAYMFRNTCTQIENVGTIINCFASIKRDTLDLDMFVVGFNKALQDLQKRHAQYQYVTIEDIADNHHILKVWNKEQEADSVTPTAFFFYNFAYPPFRPNRVLLLY